MRRLPVYLLIDTSGSMRGEPIESVKVGLETMVSSLRQDPLALTDVNSYNNPLRGYSYD